MKELLKKHGDRLRRGVPPNPTSAILPVTHNRPSHSQEMRKSAGIHSIRECLQSAPSTFTVQFEISHTIPECNLSSTEEIKALYKRKKDGTSSFRFALHLKDSSSEVDVLCLGKVAEQLLGITTQDAIDENPDKCQHALEMLRELMSPGSVCEGKIRSTQAKDGKLYFILKSLFCITA